jgi:hypothetical protein
MTEASGAAEAPEARFWAADYRSFLRAHVAQHAASFGSGVRFETSSWWAAMSWTVGGVARVAHRARRQLEEAWSDIDSAAGST